MTGQRTIDAVLREDLGAFIHKSFQTVSPAQEFHPNWHLRAMAWHLRQCLDGKTRRLIIMVPPRSLKSISASVAFPAYVLGRDPSRKVVCASYSSELAEKHARDCRAILQSAWYQRLFPETRISQSRQAVHDFTTTRQGFRYTTSVCGTLTGRGGNIIIIDDPMKSDEAMSEARRKSVNEWFDNTIHTRLDDKRNDVIIVVMQRLHMDDLVGHLLQKNPGEWTVLRLPAIAEEDEDIQIGLNRVHHRRAGDLLHGHREPHEVLENLRVNMGSYHFAAQYQQNPIPQDGEIFKWKWFQTYDQPFTQIPTGKDRIVQSWDTASKAGELNDYSVCTTWLVRDKKYYLLDLYRAKLNYPDLRKAAIDRAKLYYGVEIVIEDTAAGTPLIQELRAAKLPYVKSIFPVKPVGDKVMRASGVSALIEQGKVYLPRNATWLEALRSELLQFPNGRHDDQVDSITQFLLRERQRPYNTARVGVTVGLY